MGVAGDLHTHYGMVSLKDRPMTQATEKIWEIVAETELAATREEQRLVARWLCGHTRVHPR